MVYGTQRINLLLLTSSKLLIHSDFQKGLRVALASGGWIESEQLDIELPDIYGRGKPI